MTIELVGGPFDGLIVEIPPGFTSYLIHRAIELSWNPFRPLRVEHYLYTQRDGQPLYFDYDRVTTTEELEAHGTSNS